jgi:hypothetical protein
VTAPECASAFSAGILPISQLAGNRQYRGYALTNSDLSSHAINQPLGIVANPGLKHSLDVLDLVNSF